VLLAKDTCVIRRENNVVVVDFTRKPPERRWRSLPGEQEHGSWRS
jgi:hypothetical protein